MIAGEDVLSGNGGDIDREVPVKDKVGAPIDMVVAGDDLRGGELKHWIHTNQ
jgi:hypothetical protein